MQKSPKKTGIRIILFKICEAIVVIFSILIIIFYCLTYFIITDYALDFSTKYNIEGFYYNAFDMKINNELYKFFYPIYLVDHCLITKKTAASPPMKAYMEDEYYNKSR